MCQCITTVLQRSGRINHEVMAGMYAAVDLSKKKKRKKTSSIAMSEAFVVQINLLQWTRKINPRKQSFRKILSGLQPSIVIGPIEN